MVQSEVCPDSTRASLFSRDGMVVPVAGRWSCLFEKWRHPPAVVTLERHGLVSDDRAEQLLMRVVVEAILVVWGWFSLSVPSFLHCSPSLPWLRASVTRFPGITSQAV